MRPTRHLIALDVDGTVLTEDGALSDAVVEWVHRAVEAGNEVTLATGRNWENTRDILARLRLKPEYVVCANGALTLRRATPPEAGYRQYVVETFDPTEVLTLIHEQLPEATYMVEYPDGFRRYTVGMSEWNLDNAQEVSFEGLLAEPVCRVVVMSPEHDVEEFLRIVEGMGLKKVSYAIGWTSWLDIAPYGVSKATALEKVREALGFTADELVTVGDGRNDVEMLEWAGREGIGVAMGQAPAEVKAAATRTTGPVEDDGLADFLAELLSGEL